MSMAENLDSLLIVARDQMQAIWMAEERPGDDLGNDILFPMATRTSMTSPETDAMSRSMTESQMSEGLTRSNSDTNLGKNHPMSPPRPLGHRVY